MMDRPVVGCINTFFALGKMVPNIELAAALLTTKMKIDDYGNI